MDISKKEIEQKTSEKTQDVPAIGTIILSAIRKNPVIVASVLILFATAFVYWNLPSHEFVNFDDKLQITENTDLHRGLSGGDLGWVFSIKNPKDYWYPLTWLSLALNYEIGELNPFGYHLFNLLLHALSALLLFFVLKKMTGRLWESAAVALLFAVHPVNVESVAWAFQRKSTLSTFFAMLCLLSYAHYALKPRLSPYIAVCVFFFLAMTAKATIMPLCFALLLLDYWPLNRLNPKHRTSARLSIFGDGKKPVRALILEKAPLFAITIACGIMVYISFASKGQIVDQQAAPFFLRIESAILASTVYLGKTLWPAHLAIFYPMPKVFEPGRILAALLLVTAITAGVAYAAKKRPYLIVGWLWYLGIIFPYLGVFRTGMFHAGVDRAMYVPGIGLFIMAVWGLRDLAFKLPAKKTVLAVVCAAVVAALAIASKHQTFFWQNSETLFTQALNNTENNYVAHNGLGIELKRQGRLEQAKEHFEQALSINPSYTKAGNNLAGVLVDLQKPDEALAQLEKNLINSASDANIHCKIGALLIDLEKYDEALKHFTIARQLTPNDSNVYNNLGVLSASIGQSNKALDFFNMALTLNPQNPDTHNNIGSVLANLGDIQGAMRHIQKALKLAPRSKKTINNLASLMFQTGNFAQGIKQIQKLVEIAPDDTEARTVLAMILLQGGACDEALRHFDILARDMPDDFNAQYQLAQTLLTMGRLEDAYMSLQRALSINPDHAGAHNKMGVLLSNLGYNEEAVEHLEKSLTLDPEFKSAKQNLELVKSRMQEAEDK